MVSFKTYYKKQGTPNCQGKADIKKRVPDPAQYKGYNGKACDEGIALPVNGGNGVFYGIGNAHLNRSDYVACCLSIMTRKLNRKRVVSAGEYPFRRFHVPRAAGLQLRLPPVDGSTSLHTGLFS